MLGDRSWSIDMQRYNFQFTGQTFHRIRSGRVEGMLRDVAYQGEHPGVLVPARAVGGSGDVVAAGRTQLRQGPAGPGRPGQPRLPGGRGLPGRRPQHRAGGRMSVEQGTGATVGVEPLVAAALAAGDRQGADDVVVVVHRTDATNLRWAANQLTTTGTTSTTSVGVVAVRDLDGRTRLRRAHPPGRRPVGRRAAGGRRRRRGPRADAAEDAATLPEGPQSTTSPRSHRRPPPSGWPAPPPRWATCSPPPRPSRAGDVRLRRARRRHHLDGDAPAPATGRSSRTARSS